MAGVEGWWGRQPPSYPGTPHPVPIYPRYPKSRVRRFFYFQNFLTLKQVEAKLTGGFFGCFLCSLFNSASSAAPLDATVSDDAGIEPRTVATLALAVKHSNNSARSNQPSSIRAILKVGCAGFFTSKNFLTLKQNDAKFLDFFFQHCFICHPSDSTVSEDDGVEPSTAATLTLAVKRSNHSARSNQPPSIRPILKVGCACFFTSKFSHFETAWSEISRGILLDFLKMHLFNTASSAAPFNTASCAATLDSTVSEDDGVKSRTVATLELAGKRSNHFARSNQPPSIRSILKVECAGFFHFKFSHLKKIRSEINRGNC